MSTPITAEDRREVESMVEFAVRKAHPDADAATTTHLQLAYAVREYTLHAAHERFGPDHGLTRAYAEFAGKLAMPIGEETQRLAVAALTLQPVED